MYLLFLSQERMEEKTASLLSPLQLAYVGDAVWEILIRQMLAMQQLNVHHMHNECIRQVNAKAQAEYMARVKTRLTEIEQQIVQRGRNVHARHSAPRNQRPSDYSEATAFEALIGFLYLTDQQERLKDIFLWAVHSKPDQV